LTGYKREPNQTKSISLQSAAIVTRPETTHPTRTHDPSQKQLECRYQHLTSSTPAKESSGPHQATTNQGILGPQQPDKNVSF